MKKTILLLSTLMLTSITTFSQWTQKADFGGTARCYAVGFSIGSKGYIGTGYTGYYKDFWEWDGDTASLNYNTWTQKADFPADGRCLAIGFSIGSKGYVALGSTGSWKNDFWEWDGDTASLNYNTWGYAGMAGSGKEGAVCFSVGAKAYFGTGFNGTDTKDFWEFNPSGYNYTQMADYLGAGGNGVESAVGFSIGPYGYVGTGATNTYSDGHNDFWQYDTSGNIWTPKASLPASYTVFAAVGFSIGTKGFIGTGYVNGQSCTDFYEYDPDFDSWTPKQNFPDTARWGAVGFSIGNRGYIGTGTFDGGIMLKHFWEYYDPTIVVNIPKITDESIVKIFPNPATDNLEIETSQKSVPIAIGIEILNIQGKLIKSITADKSHTTIDISAFPCGMYFVEVKTGKNVAIQKFVKE